MDEDERPSHGPCDVQQEEGAMVTRSARRSAFLIGSRLATIAIGAAAALLIDAPTLWAIPLSQSRMIIEVNSTDGDAGIQLFVDGEGWTQLEIFDPSREKITEINAAGSIGLQGLTELFTESAEPSFEDQSLAELFERFPQGNYTLRGVTVGGKSLSGKATFRHNIPAGPDILSPSEGEEVDPGSPLVIDWDPVTTPFPGTTLAVTVVGYQVIVERLKPQPLASFSVNLPATVTHLTVSPEFIQAGAEYRIEVLAIEASGNQTITERDFETGSSAHIRLGGREVRAAGSDARLTLRASPDPAGDRASISFSTGSESRVRVAIFDVRGRLVRTLLDGARPAGRHDVSWDRRDSVGRNVSQGIYFAEVLAGGARASAKILVVR
jgi:hypothetical protein